MKKNFNAELKIGIFTLAIFLLAIGIQPVPASEPEVKTLNLYYSANISGYLEACG